MTAAVAPSLASPGILPPAGEPRFLSIQALRAVAALGVIYQHIQYDFSVKFGVAGFPPSFGLSNIGVDLFFVISGFIMVYTSERLFGRPGAWKTFLMRRVIRIVPIYWATSALALVYILLRHNENDLTPFGEFVKWVAASFAFLPYPRPNADISPLNGVGWTLNYEMFFYVLFAMAIFLPRRRAVMAVTVLFTGLALLGFVYGPLENPWAFWCDSVILEFVLGMLIAAALRHGLRLPAWLCWVFIVVGLSLFVVIDYGVPMQWPRLIYMGLPSAMIVAGCAFVERPIAAAQRIHPVTRAFAFLGDASYSIYLIHPFLLTAPRLLLFGLAGDGVTPPPQPWLYAGVQFATALAAGITLHLAFERPVTRYLRARSERRTPP